jgi:hypothetical protein
MTRSSGHALLRANRLIHLYLGIFTAPALLFFAFTGALQTFSLHETTRGSSYKPPAWAVTLGQIHKKQTPVVPVRRPPPPGASAPEAQAGGGRGGEIGSPKLRDNPSQKAERGTEKGPERQTAAADSPNGRASVPEGKKHHPLPLKIFFLIVSISLFLSTLTGIYMSFKYVRNRTVVTALLVLGAVIPVILVFV